MKVRTYLKTLVILMFVWLGFSMNENCALAEDLPEGIGASVATGSAITYYIGGEGALDTNDGMSSTTPFATLYQATNTINSKETGDYVILVQGDTIETQTSIIGNDGGTRQKVTIKNLTSNVYTINRGSNLQSMIYVNYKSSLTLGEQYGSDGINLNINGGLNNTFVNGPIINNIGDLNLYNGVSLSNNKCKNNAGAVYNGYVFNMYGGEIYNNEGMTYGAVNNQRYFKMYNGKIHNNNSSVNGGGVYNHDQFILYNGSIYSNTCSERGAGVYSDNLFYLFGGMINDNVATLDVGGVYSDRTFKMDGGSIISNSSIEGNIGGLYMSGSESKEMFDGNISGNIGVGVSVGYGSRFLIKGGTISNNTSMGVSVFGDIALENSISIKSNGSTSTNIVLQNGTSRIYLHEKIIVSEPIYITPQNYDIGRRVLDGDYYEKPSFNDPYILTESYQLFCFPDSEYK